MRQNVRIALDVMGGDHAPAMAIDGAALALERLPHTRFLLFGNQEQLEPLLQRHPKLDRKSTRLNSSH